MFQVYKVHNITWETRTGYYLFRGIRALLDTHPELSQRFHLTMWGNIFPGNLQQIEQLGLQEVVSVEGFVDREEMLRRLEASDVLFLPLESAKDGQAPLHIPGKLYDYLSLGKPVWALAQQSDCREILSKAGVGVFSDPLDEASIAETLKYLIDHKAQLAERHAPDWDYINTEFRYAVLCKRLAGMVCELQQGPG